MTPKQPLRTTSGLEPGVRRQIFGPFLATAENRQKCNKNKSGRTRVADKGRKWTRKAFKRELEGIFVVPIGEFFTLADFEKFSGPVRQAEILPDCPVFPGCPAFPEFPEFPGCPGCPGEN